MTHIDNSRIFHEGVYADASVLVPANTTYKVGTVLGRNKAGKLTAFSTDNNVAASTGVEAFTTSPLYILAQTITNESTSQAETIDLVRVFDSGAVDKAGLIFVKSADASDVKVLDEMKVNNFRLLGVEELTESTPLD